MTADSETKPARRPGRPSNRDRAEDLVSRLEQGLRGVADMLERRDQLADADSFAAILKRDAHAQAEWLAAVADNHQAAEKLILGLVGGGSLLGFAGAWGPLVSRLIDRIRLSGLLDFQLGETDELAELRDEHGAIPLPGAPSES